MKLSLIFSLFFSLALVQNIDARPSSWSNWIPSSVSSAYGTVGGYLGNLNISEESTDLLSQGSPLARQVLGFAEIVPGLEPVTAYGRMGLNVAETAVQAVNKFQEQRNSLETLNGLFNVSNSLGSYFPKIAERFETIKTGVETALETIGQMIDRINNLASVFSKLFKPA
uniref:Putative salivary secreted protein n=1 Tax=Panstrongylus lignarius TaxID=156445 RepID=A0A224XUX4_9HEMI